MMDEEKDRKQTMEVVDTSDQPAEGGRVVRETVEEHKARINPPGTTEEGVTSLFETDTADKFRTRWLAIQSRFVDDPGASVREADELVADVMARHKGMAPTRRTRTSPGGRSMVVDIPPRFDDGTAQPQPFFTN